MALNGDEEFMYTMSVQLCSQCPSVVFLNNNTVVISSSTNGQDVLLKFFYLWPWPPQQIISRALNKQPRWYWFTPSADFFPTNDPIEAPDSLSGGAIAGIIIAAIVIVSASVGVPVLVALICRRHISSQDKRKQEVVQPRLAAATDMQEGLTKQSGNNKQMMVTGYSMSSTQGSTQGSGDSSQEESKPHAVDNFQAEPSSQTKRDDNDAKPNALPKRGEITVPAEKVLKVYTDNYNKLKNILPAKNLSGHLITERVITFEDEKRILHVQSKEAASIVLEKITSSLEAGRTKSFYKLLDIMKDHGGELSCVELANQIRGELSGNTTTSQ